MGNYDQRTASARFWPKVNKTDTCWLWTAARTPDGYGSFDKRVAHRWAYENCVGPVPDCLELDHLCRVRHCVNPAHLEAVTRCENQRRSPVSAGGRNAAKTHCPRGHEYDESNTRIDADGSRRCRTCAVEGRAKHREEMRVWRAKKREVSQ